MKMCQRYIRDRVTRIYSRHEVGLRMTHGQLESSWKWHGTHVVVSTAVLSVGNDTITVLSTLAKVVLLEVTSLLVKSVAVVKIVDLAMKGRLGTVSENCDTRLPSSRCRRAE